MVDTQRLESAAPVVRDHAEPPSEALDTPRLAGLLYLELRRIAGWCLAGERAAWSLQPTGLTHEAILRLLKSPAGRVWDSHEHFVAAVSRTMRRILVDAARRRRSQRRGGRLVRHDITLAEVPDDDDWSETLAVDDLLERLAVSDATAARVVELRHFGGLTVPQTAAVLGVSPRTVSRRWHFACAWLRHAMSTTPPHDGARGPRAVPLPR